MSFKRWALSFALFVPVLGAVGLTGCGPAPADAPQPVEESQQELEDYNKRMQETGGRG